MSKCPQSSRAAQNYREKLWFSQTAGLALENPAGPVLRNKKARSCGLGKVWRRVPESNRPRWICNPLHNRFANAPWLLSVCSKHLGKATGFPQEAGAGNETCTRRVSRCFPNTFFTEVASEDLNCSLVFSPRQQVRLKKSTDGHRPPLRTPEPHTVRLRPRRTRTHHRPLRSLLVHPPSRVRARFFVAISGCRASMTGSGFAMSCWTSCNDCHPLAPCETAGISGHTETVLRRSPPLMTLPV